MNEFHVATTDPDGVHVLLWQEYLGLHQETFGSVDDFARQLPDMMTCAYQVVAVVAEGRALPVAKIDRMKRSALEELKDMPISYALASGRRFPPTILDDQQ